MDQPFQHLLADFERDTGAEAAEAFSRLAVAYFASTRDGDGRVSTARTPSELAARFDEPLPVHDRSLADVLSRLERDVLPDVNRLSHPRAMGHQVSAPLAVAVWTEALTAALNQSAAVWEMSPVGTIVETQVVRWMCGLAGFGPGAREARLPRAARRPPSPASSRRDRRRRQMSRAGVWALILGRRVRRARALGDGSLPATQLDLVNLDLRTACNREGDAWITTTVLGGRRVLRATVMNPRTTAADVMQLLDVLESLAGSALRRS